MGHAPPGIRRSNPRRNRKSDWCCGRRPSPRRGAGNVDSLCRLYLQACDLVFRVAGGVAGAPPRIVWKSGRCTVMEAYLIAIGIIAAIYVLLALGLNLQYRLTRPINFAPAGFFRIRAQSCALLRR